MSRAAAAAALARACQPNSLTSGLSPCWIRPSSSTLQPVLDTRTTSSNSTITSTTTPSSSTRTSTITPDKFKLHFAGRVYRPLEYYASSQEARSSYTTKGDWLGQPDERVEDKDAVIDCPCGDNSESESR